MLFFGIIRLLFRLSGPFRFARSFSVPPSFSVLSVPPFRLFAVLFFFFGPPVLKGTAVPGKPKRKGEGRRRNPEKEERGIGGGELRGTGAETREKPRRGKRKIKRKAKARQNRKEKEKTGMGQSCSAICCGCKKS